MSSLLNRATTMQSTLLDRGRREAGLQATQRLTQQKERVDDCVSALNAAIELERRLTVESLTVPSLDKVALETARKARTSFRTAATKLDAPDLSDDATVTVLDGKSLGDAVKAADLLIDRALARIKTALAEERNAGLPAGMSDPIPDVPRQVGRRIRLDECRRRLQAPIDLTRSQLTPDGIERVLTKRIERRSDLDFWLQEMPILLDALAKEGPEIRRFLQAAASAEGAPLALLTPEVKDRLVEDGLVDDFRIRRNDEQG